MHGDLPLRKITPGKSRRIGIMDTTQFEVWEFECCPHCATQFVEMLDAAGIIGSGHVDEHDPVVPPGS